jgi:hypothetical protein
VTAAWPQPRHGQGVGYVRLALGHGEVLRCTLAWLWPGHGAQL